MNISISYFGQLATATGKKDENIDAADGETLRGLLISRADTYGETFRKIILDENDELRPSVIILINELAAVKEKDTALQPGDKIKLLAAIAGG